jgi:hypothetical protein
MTIDRVLIVVLIVGSISVGCSNDDDGASDGEVVQIPEEHPAALTLATAPTYEEFANVALAEDLRFVCAASSTWQVCLLPADDLLAVVPFDVPPGLIGTVESGSLEEAVSFPLDQGAIGIAGVELSPTLTLELDGEVVGSVSGP